MDETKDKIVPSGRDRNGGLRIGEFERQLFIQALNQQPKTLAQAQERNFNDMKFGIFMNELKKAGIDPKYQQ